MPRIFLRDYSMIRVEYRMSKIRIYISLMIANASPRVEGFVARFTVESV